MQPHFPPACGDVIITLHGSTIQTGGAGHVDVFISSNAEPTAPDLVDSFSVKFRITPEAGSVADGLQFVDPQSDSQLLFSQYIFSGNSLFAPLGPLGLVSTEVNTNDLYIGGDSTIDVLGRALDKDSTPMLLFRLDLSAATAVNGNRFTLQVVDDPVTEFTDPDISPLTIDDSSFAALTVTAVPEPGAMGLILSGTAAAAIRYRRRRQAELSTNENR